MMKPQIIVEATPAALVERVGARFIEAARQSIETDGGFSFALSGGSTPKALYEYLALPEQSSRIEWDKVHVFFGDERAVSPEDPLSNYRMACEALLDHIPIPADNIFRMEAERESLEAAADDYDQKLRLAMPINLVLLGMGDDGHTASLFPFSPVLNETEKLCAATPVASLQPHVRRLTLTFPAIDGAERVWALITGSGKTERLKRVRANIENKELDVQNMPVQGVRPKGEYIWWLDAAVAGE